MKIFMAGSGGMLGDAFYNEFKTAFNLKCTDIDLNSEWLTYLDFRNYDEYYKQVLEFKPDWIFHLGAFTDLEYCEKNITETYETNTKAVENAVKISNEFKIPILYISTAGIFDGLKDFYNENDIPSPIGHYGKSKFLGEKYVLNNAHDFLICRAGWMMGGGPNKDKKFVQKILSKLKNGEKVLNIVNDKLGTPTYTHDFAKNTLLLLNNNKRGLYNMVCGGFTGRLEVAKEIIKILNIENRIVINEVSTEYFSKEYFAERPACERLLNEKLNNSNLNIMRDWKIALKEYLENYYSNYLN
jgi:dTDP-4-dehydrorhamnose reductase